MSAARVASAKGELTHPRACGVGAGHGQHEPHRQGNEEGSTLVVGSPPRRVLERGAGRSRENPANTGCSRGRSQHAPHIVWTRPPARPCPLPVTPRSPGLLWPLRDSGGGRAGPEAPRCPAGSLSRTGGVPRPPTLAAVAPRTPRPRGEASAASDAA